MAITYIGSAATNYISGSNTVSQSLFALENSGSGSPVVVRVKRLVVQLDATAVLASPMPIVRTSRVTSLPSIGGTELSKQTFDTLSGSNEIGRAHV